MKIFDSPWWLERWRVMYLIRRAEEAIARMIETGEVRCPCHLCIGQEAVAAGVCAALTREDTVWGGHRSHGHYLAKGGSLEQLFAEILGRTTGCSGGRGGSMHLIDEHAGVGGTVPIVAGTVPLAAGAALAYKMRGEKRVAVSFFGDGALEEGHVHEILNLASLYQLPLLLVCENNLYSSHMHFSERRASDRLYECARAHAIPGFQIDGNDVEDVFTCARDAVERALTGGGPTFFECRTFRWRGHVGASFDLDVGVKRAGELSEWLLKDPLSHAENVLAGMGVSLTEEKQVLEDRIEAALEAARRGPASDPARLLEHVWVEAAPA